jgi:hypothetical protein
MCPGFRQIQEEVARVHRGTSHVAIESRLKAEAKGIGAAALEAGRQFIGIEKSAEYAEKARRRLDGTCSRGTQVETPKEADPRAVLVGDHAAYAILCVRFERSEREPDRIQV